MGGEDIAAAVKACPPAAFRRGAQGVPIQNGCGGLRMTPACHAQQFTQVMDNGLEAACRDPAMCLLIHYAPGRKIVGNHAPRSACANHPAQAIEGFAQQIVTLGRFLGHQGQVGSHKSPFGIGDITWVGFSFRFAGKTYRPNTPRPPKVPNTL